MKTWEKPQLVTLVRSNPEEAVLTGCKMIYSGASPNQVDAQCFNKEEPSPCLRCYDFLTS